VNLTPFAIRFSYIIKVGKHSFAWDWNSTRL